MDKYLEENIKYESQLFSLFFYLCIAISTGLIGLLLSDDFGSKKLLLLLFFIGFVFVIGLITYLFYLNGVIKSQIKKLKKNEF